MTDSIASRGRCLPGGSRGAHEGDMSEKPICDKCAADPRVTPGTCECRIHKDVTDKPQTHYEGCWTSPRHHACAVARIAALDAENTKLKQQNHNLRVDAFDAGPAKDELIEDLQRQVAALSDGSEYTAMKARLQRLIDAAKGDKRIAALEEENEALNMIRDDYVPMDSRVRELEEQLRDACDLLDTWTEYGCECRYDIINGYEHECGIDRVENFVTKARAVLETK